MRWGNVDYKQLQKLRDNLQKLQDMDLDKFCEDVSKELAARLLALVIPRTPVGQYPRSSGKKGGTLRRGWTARTEQEAAGGPFTSRSSTLSTTPAMWSLDTAPVAEAAGWPGSISSPCLKRTLSGWPPPSLRKSWRRCCGRLSMSEISFKSIYDGVSLALHAAFPAVQVHGGNVKQGLNPGDLNVVMPSAGQSKQVGERFLRTLTLDVIYYPKVGVAECCEVADQLTMLLRDITTPEGDLIHCTNCEWTIEEGVLHVLVSYDHHAYIPQEPVLMETLDIEMEG